MDICCSLTKEAVAEMRSAPTVTLAFPDCKIAGVEFQNIFIAALAWGVLPEHNMKSGKPCLNSRGKGMRGLSEGGPFAWGQILASCEEGCGQFTIAQISSS